MDCIENHFWFCNQDFDGGVEGLKVLVFPFP